MTDEKRATPEEIFSGFPKFPVKVGDDPEPRTGGRRTLVKTYYLAEPEDYDAYLKAIENAGFIRTEWIDEPIPGGIHYYAVFRKDDRVFTLHYSPSGKRIAVTGSTERFDRPWTKADAFRLLPTPSFGRITNPEHPEKTGSVAEAAWSTGEGFYTAMITDVTPDDYKAYQSALTAAGYRLFAENRDGINGDVFAARYEKSVMGSGIAGDPKTSEVSLTYFNRTSRLDVTAGFDSPASPHLLDRSEWSAGEIPGRKTELHMLQLFTTGNSFVFRLKNGHFLVSDGAISWDLKYLLDYLEELAPEGEKPVIESWVITHPHGDHLGCFEEFYRRPEFAERVAVDGFYYNVPGDLVFTLEPGCRNDVTNMYLSLALMKTSQGGPTPLFRTHTGERYYFDGVTMDIAVGADDIPFPTYSGDINDSSTWACYNIEGQTVMMGGDGDRGGFAVLRDNYAHEYCNFDFFSVLHHGHNITEPIANYVNPVTCICPAPDEGPDYRREWTHLLRRKSREYIDFGEGTRVFEFPYRVGEYRTLPPNPWKYDPGREPYYPKHFSKIPGGGLLIWCGRFICPPEGFGSRTPVFVKDFPKDDRPIAKVKLYLTAMGVYEAKLNGKRVGDFILAPGWTSYERLQYQEYDVTDLYVKGGENRLEVTVGNGWYGSTLMYTTNRRIEGKISVQEPYLLLPRGILAEVRFYYEDGHREAFGTDTSWDVYDGPVRLNGIYEGEVYDATVPMLKVGSARMFNGGGSAVVPTLGEIVREHEKLDAVSIIRTPRGEYVIDFGQEITGYIETSIPDAHKGDVIDLSFGETLDRDGNFYNDNYRGARCFYRYTCVDGAQTYKPSLTFYGFRYAKINEFPGKPKAAKPEYFKAIAVYSDIHKTGSIESSNPLLNKLFSNIVWGQKDNFLDVPTDCPQRNERLGWTGDVTAVCRSACFNFDMDRFFTKWLRDLAIDQLPSGMIDAVIPAQSNRETASAMWGDVTTVLPWQLYLNYGDEETLRRQYPSMKLWVKYITDTTTTEYLWTGPHKHYGDWLGLDAPSGSYKGSSREWYIASAFYYHSVEIVVKAGRVLGEDVSYYETLLDRIRDAFRSEYPTTTTQTECVLALYFGLAADKEKTAKELADRVTKAGHLETGFVGTPYLLHALSDNGYAEIAYDLLLREAYPGWLYAVRKGATTTWEHWDSIMEDGSFWSTDMNSLNHYAYGAVADWIYMKACGIQYVEEAPGFEKVRIAPIPTEKLDHLEASLESRHGFIRSRWEKTEGGFLYDVTVPVEAEITAGGKTVTVPAGRYIFKNQPDYNAKRA